MPSQVVIRSERPIPVTSAFGKREKFVINSKDGVTWARGHGTSTMADPAPCYSLNLMGAFRLTTPDGRRIEIASKKGAALIAMLAMSDDGERARGWLQEKLWGSRDTPQAANSLRRELSELRRRLNAAEQPLLVCERGRVRLDLSQIRVDVAPGGVNGGRRSGTASGHEFLEGVDIPGEEGFEDWLRSQRSDLVALSRQAVVGLPDPIPPNSHDERPTIAVLAFDHPANDETHAYFAEGVAEEIIAGLARSRLLSVKARQSSLNYRSAGRTAAQIGSDLGVRYLVQGHVRRMGSVARVTAELVCAEDERTIWSARYDRSLDELFAVQDEITAAIVGALEPALLDNEELTALRGPRRDPRHWDLYIRGRWLFWRAPFGEGKEVVATLRAAEALDPDHAPTLSLLALCYLADVWAGAAEDPRRNISEAHTLALRAVALDGADALAHGSLGTVLSTMGNIDQAMAEQRRALELNPYLAPAAGELARLHLFLGEVDEARRQADRAIAISPNDPHVFLWYRTKALASFVAGRHGEAATFAADACARGPHHFFLYYLLAACHAAAGAADKARGALAEGRRLRPRYGLTALRVGHPFAASEHLDRLILALRAAGWDDE